MERIEAPHHLYTSPGELYRNKGEPAQAYDREKKLAKELEARLANSLEQIRVRLNGATTRNSPIDSPNRTGKELDILA